MKNVAVANRTDWEMSASIRTATATRNGRKNAGNCNVVSLPCRPFDCWILKGGNMAKEEYHMVEYQLAEQQKKVQRLLELLAKCNGVLVAYGYDENEGIRKEVETELGYT